MAEKSTGDAEFSSSNPLEERPEKSFQSDPLGSVPLAYDFKRPQSVNKDRIRAVESLHEQFSRLFSSTFAASMRMVVDVDMAFVDQPLYGEFILSLPTPCGAFTFTIEPTGGKALLCLSPELMLSVVDRALGGKGVGTSGDMRPPTSIERTIINKLVSRLLRDFETAWEPHFPLEVADVTLETNPEFIQVANSGDPAIVAAFEANSSTLNGLVHLCYPLSTLEALIPRLQMDAGGHPENQTRGNIAANNRSLSKMQVSTIVQVAQGSLSLKEVADLQRGDVIKLDTKKSEPAVVFVGDQPKFFARAGLDGRQRAAQIISTLQASEEELYR